MHTIQGQSNGNSESSRNAVMEEAIQQPASTPDERPENWPSPNTLTALDTRQQWESPVRLEQKPKSGWQ
ncbi:hypothetical protein HAV15_011258 [Penicillium sp. str. |nr:hypothetical protein HAV15_011258 [Penicillium sp. str. \